MRMTYEFWPQPRLGLILWTTFILFSGGQAATNMALLFILLQNLSNLQVQSVVEFRQALLKVLVYSGFGYAKMSGGGTDGGPMLNDKCSQFAGSLLDGICHIHPSDAVLLRKIYAPENCDMPLTESRSEDKINRREM